MTAAAETTVPDGPWPSPRRSLAAAAVAAAVASTAMLALLGLAGLTAGLTAPHTTPEGSGASAFARADIPAAYLALYIEAARRYGLDWAVLAAIGKVECDQGRDPDPSCHVPGSVNSAGAGGPMQFIASTWARYGVDVDGVGPGSRWDLADAIFGAANYLRASGAPGDYRRAIYAYNHASWYVAEVQQWAARYRVALSTRAAGGQSAPSSEVEQELLARLAAGSTTRVVPVEGERALLAAGDGHLALVPTGVPAAVQAMVVAGNELQELPYGPAGHPDPLGAAEEDCSSTVNYVLYRAGVRSLRELLRQNPLAQSYVDWGAPGPGRWVTIYAADTPTPHVFIVIAGLRLDTSHDGTDVGPNRDEDGPRWRIFPSIPTWARWSVRHPPGL